LPFAFGVWLPSRLCPCPGPSTTPSTTPTVLLPHLPKKPHVPIPYVLDWADLRLVASSRATCAFRQAGRTTSHLTNLIRLSLS
jgi:hypothetical protein